MSVVEFPQSKNPFDTSRFKSPEDYQRGIPVTSGPHPWHWVPLLPADLVLAAFMGYQPYCRDDVDWIQFAQRMKDSVVVFRQGAWISADQCEPGLHLVLHVGGLPTNEKSPSMRDDDTKELLDTLCTAFQVPMLRAFLPQHARAARMLAKWHGFIHFGILPLDGTFNGVPRNVDVFGYTGKR